VCVCVIGSSIIKLPIYVILFPNSSSGPYAFKASNSSISTSVVVVVVGGGGGGGGSACSGSGVVVIVVGNGCGKSAILTFAIEHQRCQIVVKCYWN